ncbi:MAG TPA: hypothetical protein VL225_10520 [Vicinamibacterales bacterium]|nr:hypothetical protein [Vicinamibacterales bacterium]
MGAALFAAIVMATQVATGASHHSHIRTQDERSQDLIAMAVDRSTAFRQLLDRLDRSSIVVYVEFGACPGRADACLHFVAAAPPYMYLRATIARFVAWDAVLAGLIAHELGHACELADAGVMTLEEFKGFYAGHGRLGSAGYETDAAIAAGVVVERETSSRKRRTARGS